MSTRLPGLRARFVRGLLLALAVTGVWACTAAAQPGAVMDSLASPCRYPSGLAWDGTWFYVADWRAGEIHRIDPSTGALRETKTAPTLRPRGLTCGPGTGQLIVADDRSGWIFAWDFDTGVVKRTFQAAGAKAAGLA